VRGGRTEANGSAEGRPSKSNGHAAE